MTCWEAFRDETGEVQVTMRARQSGDEVVVAVSGYRGVRAYLPPQPMETVATRPSERIFQNECSTAQWDKIESHRAALQGALEWQRENTSLTHLCQGGTLDGSTLLKTRGGQQSLRAYGQTRQACPFPTVGRMREVKQQSAADWSFHNCPLTVGNIVFDTSTMTPSPVCVPQGTWSATARHGQATLQQHPMPLAREAAKAHGPGHHH